MPSQKKVTLADSLGIESQVVSSSLANISKRRKLEEHQEDGLHKKEDWSKVSEKQKMMEEMLDMEVDFLPSQKKVKRATKKDEVKLSTAVSELRKSTMAVNENIIIAETPEAFPSSTKMEIKPVLVPKSPPITKKLAETELDPFEVGIKPRSPSALRKNKISISSKDARSKNLKKPNVKIIGLVGQKLKNFKQCHEELESLYDKEGKRNLNFKDDEDPEDKIASDYEGEEVVKEEDKVEVKVNFVDLFCKKKVYSINENGIYNDGPNFKRFVKNGTSTTGTLWAPIPLLATKPREAIVVGGKTQPWLKQKRNKKVKKYKFTKPRKTKRKDEAVACEPADRLLLYSSGGSDESDAEEDDDDESEEEFEVNKRNVSNMQASNIKRNLEERSESEEEEVAELPNPLKRRRRQAGKNYNLMDSDDDDDC